MNNSGRQAHWENIYRSKGEREVSWFEESPTLSLELIHAAGVDRRAAIIDIGGGASRLVDALLDEGFADVTVLDLSSSALNMAKVRLRARSGQVRWLTADVTSWQPSRRYDLWHDRAVFHFLMQANERAAYAERAFEALRPGGQIIIGTFAPDGPQRCSGLPVVRHDAASIGAILGSSFTLVENRRHDHHTPAGTLQRFQFSRFVRSS